MSFLCLLIPSFLGDAKSVTGTFLAGGPDSETTVATTRLMLGPDRRFRLTSAETIESRPRTYQGTFRVDDGTVTLSPEHDETREGFPRVPVEWRIVPWGPRTYLVPTGRIIAFCNAVNLGTEPRDGLGGQFLLREKDWAKLVTGKPDLGEAWSAHLLDEPIRGRLIEIDENGFGKLDVGGNQGLAGGMVLIAHTFDRLRACQLEVICPCEDNATVELLPIDIPGHPAAGLIDVQPGDEVATTLELPQGYPLGDLPKIEVLNEPEKQRRIKGQFSEIFPTLAPRDRSRFDALWRRVLPRVVLEVAGEVPVTRIEGSRPVRWTIHSDGGDRLLYRPDPNGLYEVKPQLVIDACVFNRKTGLIEAVYVTRKDFDRPPTAPQPGASQPTGSRPRN